MRRRDRAESEDLERARAYCYNALVRTSVRPLNYIRKEPMLTENVYAAPEAPLAEQDIHVPDEILKKIKAGWVAALISAAMTLAVTLIAMAGTDIAGFSAWQLIDVGLILGLAFGIYKKSRTCAVIMLLYFAAGKIMAVMESGKPTGIVMGLVFTIFFWKAVAGTFAYHAFKKEAASAAQG